MQSLLAESDVIIRRKQSLKIKKQNITQYRTRRCGVGFQFFMFFGKAQQEMRQYDFDA